MQSAHTLSPSPDRLEQLAAWWVTPDAVALWRREGAAVEEWLSRCFGYHAALLGLQPALLGEVRGLRIPHHFTLGPRAGDVKGLFEALPLAAESVDLLLLHHVLEYALNPHQVLREADRVLLPEGHLLLMNFNPFSFWGVRRLIHGGRRVPWCGHRLGRKRLHDWLGLLGYDVQAEAWVGHGCLRDFNRDGGGWIEQWGVRFLPRLGMSHLLLARKRVSMPAPIRHRWSLIPALGIKERQVQARHTMGRQA
ncbi:MAG: methyltransferase domain-containing protein [Gammaproteobacteria bacterium]|nr:methyltransferase domain-containing protein [Gammaproteobacteria bacterium]